MDLDDEGDSIFNRKKPLAEATLQRIYYGLIKFVAGGRDAFLIKWNSMHEGKCNPPDMDEPCPTIAAQPRLGVAKVNFYQPAATVLTLIASMDKRPPYLINSETGSSIIEILPDGQYRGTKEIHR